MNRHAFVIGLGALVVTPDRVAAERAGKVWRIANVLAGTSGTLALTIPPSLLLRADQVIE
jgi:hypothetical protein